MSKIKKIFWVCAKTIFSCFINADRCYMNEIGLMNKYLNEHSHVSDCGLGIFNEIEISICVCLHSNSKWQQAWNDWIFPTKCVIFSIKFVFDKNLFALINLIYFTNIFKIIRTIRTNNEEIKRINIFDYFNHLMLFHFL